MLSPPEPLILEPRLRSSAGHYAELIRAIVHGSSSVKRVSIAIPADSMELGRRLNAADGRGPIVEPILFSGRSAAAEAGFAIDAARQGRHVLILTAKGVHTTTLSLCRAGGPTLEAVSLLFHWPARTIGERTLHRLGVRARRHCLALATTSSVAHSLRSLGWRRVREIAYPMLSSDTPPAPTEFSHVLLAGPIRANKGLRAVAELIERWAARDIATPILLQSTPKHGARHGHRERECMRRIESSRCPGLQLDPAAEDRARYLRRYSGAITLVAYDPSVFADQVSGVSLDALLCGSPIIASEGTRSAELVREFDAGKVVPFDDAEAIDEAIHRIRDDWDRHSAAARTASRVLSARHDPALFVKAWLDRA